MTFLSFMRKEKTRKIFESSKKVYGSARLKNSKSNDSTRRNLEELIKFRNELRKSEYGAQSTIKNILLLLGFGFLIFFLLSLFISI